jgi:hypothetical protein
MCPVSNSWEVADARLWWRVDDQPWWSHLIIGVQDGQIYSLSLTRSISTDLVYHQVNFVLPKQDKLPSSRRLLFDNGGAAYYEGLHTPLAVNGAYAIDLYTMLRPVLQQCPGTT